MVRRDFEPQRQKGFLDLALDRPLVAEKQVLGELLGDRRSALAHPAGARVGDEGAGGARNVDSKVVVEAAILGGQDGLDQMIGHFLERDRIILLHPTAADLVAVAIEESDCDFRPAQPVFV